MSIALLVEKPCIMYGGRSVQWLALSAQLPRTSGQGRLRVAWQLGGSIVRHRLSFHLAMKQHHDKNLRHNEWKRVGISISPSHKFILIYHLNCTTGPGGPDGGGGGGGGGG